MRARRFLLGVFWLSWAGAVGAGCMSDCDSDYEDAAQACSLLYQGADDADSLVGCVEDAREEHEACTDECES